MQYKAEYENDDTFEIIIADNDNDAIEQAKIYEDNNGILFNVVLLDDNYNEIKIVF